jgi:chromosomal replication initiation ATPase DnaA
MPVIHPRWGAPRVRGELLKLGFQISEPTVSRYLRGLKRHPDVGKAWRWLAFFSNHRQSAALLEASIKQHCKVLRMPAVASQFVSLAEQAVKENQSHYGYLEALLATEIEERERNTVERRIREAHLPRLKTLDEFDFTQCPQVNAAQVRELAEGGYIARAEPVLFIGECGTGKTHLLTGLCVAACRQKRRVRFTTAAAPDQIRGGHFFRHVSWWHQRDLLRKSTCYGRKPRSTGKALDRSRRYQQAPE